MILEFLPELLHKGYKYHTVGVYRSTISNFHQPIDGIVIGKHPLMSKFMKEVYSMCPPEPKYFVTWDVNQVLSFLKTWASNFHQPIDGIVIGKHPLMSKFMKEVYSMCPPEPKYFVTWDVNQVLSFLKTWAPAEKLTLKQLTLKLVTLAALLQLEVHLCIKWICISDSLNQMGYSLRSLS